MPATRPKRFTTKAYGVATTRCWLSIAIVKGALVTLDLDFADIRAFPHAASAGLVVLRVHDQSRPHVLKVLSQILGLLQHEPVAGRLWIVTEAGVRIRAK